MRHRQPSSAEKKLLIGLWNSFAGKYESSSVSDFFHLQLYMGIDDNTATVYSSIKASLDIHL
jgi:hypothetical protein